MHERKVLEAFEQADQPEQLRFLRILAMTGLSRGTAVHALGRLVEKDI